MRNFKHKLVLLVALFWAYAGWGQSDLTLYNMQFVPQSMYSNPGIMPLYKVNIGLPVISSMYGSVGNNGFAWKNLFALDSDDSLSFTPDVMLDKLAKRNMASVNVATDIFSLGFRIKENNYLSLNWTAKAFGRFIYNRDLMTLLLKGNGDELIGQTADFSGFGVNASAYHEFGLGFMRNVNEKLSVGGKLKYLRGIGNIDFDTRDLSLTTDGTFYDLTVNSDITVNTSVDTAAFNQDPIPASALLGKNSGFGIDLGAQYKINDKIRVHASVLDLGFINWKNVPQNYTVNGGSFTYSGLDVVGISNQVDSLNQLDGAYIDSLFTAMGDSIAEQFGIDSTNNAYKTPLMTRFHVGGNYAFSEKLDAGLLFTGELYKGTLRPAVTASINARLLYWLSAQLNWSYYNRSAANMGFGLSVNGGPVQLYVATDNFLAPLMPQNARQAHVHAGLNLTFGRPDKDRDKDGILDKEDECPDEPGLPEFSGCPDRDGDHIMDKNDACPDVPGVPEFSGCPDTDADGTVDSLDNCVNEPGPKDLAGCPDRDGDKIIDKEDKCPDDPGPKETMGCPDRDRDGVLDRDDQCPDKPGDPAHAGCPDSDGDGLYDNEDRCPTEFGPTDNAGCPYGDFDKDGIFDKEDRCPDTPGPRENQGCPWGDMDGDGITDNVDKCPKTPGVPELEGCPKLEEKEQEILDMAFKNLEFESGKAIIRATSYPSLDSLAALMVKKQDMRLRIAGHTDDVGNDAANMTLSKNRSNAVRDYLNQRGVAVERFVVEWYGETKPLCPEKTPACRQRNRRVEMSPIFE